LQFGAAIGMTIYGCITKVASGLFSGQASNEVFPKYLSIAFFHSDGHEPSIEHIYHSSFSLLMTLKQVF